MKELSDFHGGWATLSRLTGYQEARLRALARRGTGLKVDVAERIVEKTGCRREWLEFGRGPMRPAKVGHNIAETTEHYETPRTMEIVFELPLDIRPGQRIMGTVRLKRGESQGGEKP